MGASPCIFGSCLGIMAIFVVIPTLVLASVNMWYATHDDDLACNVEKDSLGMALSDWLFWLAIAQFIMAGILVYVFGALGLTMCCAADDNSSVGCLAAGGSGACLGMLPLWAGSLFMIAWSVVGAIILFTDDLPCLQDGESLGILALINLIFIWVSVLSSNSAAGGARGAVSTDDD